MCSFEGTSHIPVLTMLSDVKVSLQLSFGIRVFFCIVFCLAVGDYTVPISLANKGPIDNENLYTTHVLPGPISHLESEVLTSLRVVLVLLIQMLLHV